MEATIPGRGDVPLFGSEAAGLRLELLLREDCAEDPFVPLDDTGRFARILLGRIALGDATTLKLLAVKLQRHSYAPSPPPLGQSELTNPEVEGMWLKEREKLLGSACGEVARILDLGESRWHQKPVTFCTRIRAYFHPPCPTCAASLVDCRDDDLLHHSGLPCFSESLARYLYCPACASRSGASFYSYASQPGERPEAGIVVRRRAELYRDYLGLLERQGPEATEGASSAGFPCRSCDHRAECYPSDVAPGVAIPAEGRLVPLSYHESYVLLLEAPHLRLDELSDLASGRDWEEIQRLAVETSGSSGRSTILEALDARFRGGLKRLFRGDPTGKDAMEILWIKLTAFLEVCRGVRAYHAAWGEPLLRLSPASIGTTFPEAGSEPPAEWSFQPKLWDLGGPRRLEIPVPLGTSARAGARERPGRLLLVPGECPKEYVSPLALEPPPGSEEPARITIRRAREAEGTQGGATRTGASQAGASQAGGTERGRLDIEAATRTRLKAYRPGDVARLVLSSPPPWLLDTQLWARIICISDGGASLEAFLPEGVAPPKGAAFPLVLDGRLALYKKLGPPCDLYSLGMSLFRMVLADDEQSFVEVEETVRRVLGQLASSFPERDKAEGVSSAKVLGQLEWQFEAARDVFSQDRLARRASGGDGPNGVVETRAHARREPRAGVPGSIWFDLLSLGFRLLSSLRGFGYASDHAGDASDRPEALLSAVLEDVALLRARIQVELFSAPGRDQEIREACDDLIAEITRRSLGAHGGGGGKALGGSEEAERS